MSQNSAEMSDHPVTRVTLVSWALLSFLATYAGPFGTIAYPVQMRAVFWSVVVVSATLIARASMWAAERYLPVKTGLSVDVAVSIMMVVFFTPVLQTSAVVMFSNQAGFSTTYPAFLQYVAIISVSICIVRRMAARVIGQHMAGLYEKITNDVSKPQPQLIRRLPDDFVGPILRLTVEDHLVDVVADCGTYRIRLRFADAINEMDPCIGFCTHRSHWVAADAVAGVRREAGKIWLEITNGDLVPVSRKYRPEVEAAGVL